MTTVRPPQPVRPPQIPNGADRLSAIMRSLPQHNDINDPAFINLVLKSKMRMVVVNQAGCDSPYEGCPFVELWINSTTVIRWQLSSGEFTPAWLDLWKSLGGQCEERYKDTKESVLAALAQLPSEAV